MTSFNQTKTDTNDIDYVIDRLEQSIEYLYISFILKEHLSIEAQREKGKSTTHTHTQAHTVQL